MTTPASPNPISFTQIVNEFGSLKTNSNQTGTDLGAYRVKETVGEMDDLPLDEGVPLGPNTSSGNSISFDQLRGKSLNVIVHYTGTQERPGGARAKYNGNNASDVPVIVIGGGKVRPANSSGTDVTIHISGTLHGSSSHNRNDCTLKTGGGWNSGTILNINVGGEGKITGAGGAGGDGARSYNEETESFNNGEDGEDGSSALGLAYNITELRVQNGGRIIAGGGGGGGGGIAREDSDNNNRQATGGGGGGGSGIPAGLKGVSGTPTDQTAYFNPLDYIDDEGFFVEGDSGSSSGTSGSDGSSTNGGDGGEGANNDGEAFGGGGGGGGAPDGEGGEKGEGGKTSTDGSAGQESGSGNGGDGGNASGEEGESNGGEGGLSGYAIIKKTGVNISSIVGSNRIKGGTLPNQSTLG